MTQIEIIENHLREHGYITRAVANVYNIGDLRKPISRLRAGGMNIRTTTALDDMNRPYTKYVLRQHLVAV